MLDHLKGFLKDGFDGYGKSWGPGAFDNDATTATDQQAESNNHATTSASTATDQTDASIVDTTFSLNRDPKTGGQVQLNLGGVDGDGVGTSAKEGRVGGEGKKM